MRVAIHAGQLLQPVPGGIGRYVRQLLSRLPAEGVDPVAFGAGPRPDGVSEETDWIDLGAPRGGLRYEMWHRLRRPRLPISCAVDVVHAPSLAVPPPGDRPLVVTVHDVAFLRVPERTTRRGRSFHRRGLDIARREAHVVIAPTAFTRSELVSEGFDPAAVVTIHHGADLPGPEDPLAVEAHLASVGIAPPFLLAVGTIEPRKGLPVLCDAFAALRRDHPSLTLAIAGPSGWGRVAGLEAPGIRVLGFVDVGTLDALYRRASATVIPSAYEGFGLPALEAMARGCPVVATAGSALGEVDNGAGGLLPPDDPAALTAALDALLRDPGRASELGRRGVDRAAAFTWDRAVDAHADAYTLAVRRHGQGARTGRS